MIESLKNPKVKRARALRRPRTRKREGQLFVEGLRLVEEAVGSVKVLFFTERALGNARIRKIIADQSGVAWQVTDEVMAGMTDTVAPQGIAAIVSQPKLAWPSQPTFLLIADQVRDPGNLGTLIRSAAAAGVEGLITPKGTVDPWRDKVLRAGMGAHFRLPIQDGLTWQEILPLLANLRVRLAEATGGISYDRADWSRPCALIVGGEADGAGEAASGRADETVSIPMARLVESLNAAVAGSVILFEVCRQRREYES